MNARMTARRSEAPAATPLPSDSVTIAVPLDAGTAPAANDHAVGDASAAINPLCMISVALATLFILLTMLAGD